LLLPSIFEEKIMATYVALANFTDQGVRAVKDTAKRADAMRDAGKKFGVNVTQVFWTIGTFDIVTILEAPNDETASAFALSIASLGNVRMQTLRAFSKDEMLGILGKMA
jgi:uncharacterized protein with GYD domain